MTDTMGPSMSRTDPTVAIFLRDEPLDPWIARVPPGHVTTPS